MQEGKALMSMHICTALPEPLLLNNAISTNFQVLAHFEFKIIGLFHVNYLSAHNWQEI